MLILSIASIGFSQNSAFQIGEPVSGTQFEQMFGMSQLPVTTEMTFFEGAIDPDSYQVGPGDRFKVYFWKPVYTEYHAVIGAEGEIALPLVGSVNVANMTLTEAKQAIQEAVGSALKKGGLTVTLIEPRRFRIHVTGQVNIPGTYVVTATARVADAIMLAQGLKHERSFSRGDTSSTITASQRRIEMLDASGALVGKADLLLFLKGGRLEANPMLIDGVTIFVPYPDAGESQIGVFGSVHDGGRFEYVEGDRIKDALVLAGGITSLADASSVQVFPAGAQTPRVFDITLTDNEMALLKPGDRVHVQGRPDTCRSGSVTVFGQIAKPGGYPIINGITTLADLLEQCGGFTKDAAVNSARLIRKNGSDLTKNEQFRISLSDRISRSEPAFPADPELAAEFARWDYGTVVIDLSGNGDPEPWQVELHDGDLLEVPSEPIGVRVLGFVNHGGEVPWIEDGRLNEYLELVGGINKGGWKNRTVVIRASNGSQIWYDRHMSINPGDIIFIPSKPETTNWAMFKDVVSVTAQLATLALVIQNVSK